MRALSTLKRLTAPLLLALALAPLLATTPAQAQGNSREATEAARKYRAEKARGNAPAPQRANATTPPRVGSEAPRTDQAYRSSANPNADPKASLRSCLDHSGMNMARRIPNTRPTRIWLTRLVLLTSFMRGCCCVIK